MHFRQMVCEYSQKHGGTKVARRYPLNRMFIYSQLCKWDDSVRSLALKSRHSHTSPLKHIPEKLALIYDNYIKHSLYGLTELYVRLKELDYKRSFSKNISIFSCYGKKYYQITAIDECSCKRILKIAEEKNL